MDIPLTEKQIRERASEQSFQKGQAYYKSGAIYNPARQTTPGGVTLTAQCEGQQCPILPPARGIGWRRSAVGILYLPV